MFLKSRGTDWSGLDFLFAACDSLIYSQFSHLLVPPPTHPPAPPPGGSMFPVAESWRNPSTVSLLCSGGGIISLSDNFLKLTKFATFLTLRWNITVELSAKFFKGCIFLDCTKKILCLNSLFWLPGIIGILVETTLDAHIE